MLHISKSRVFAMLIASSAFLQSSMAESANPQHPVGTRVLAELSTNGVNEALELIGQEVDLDENWLDKVDSGFPAAAGGLARLLRKMDVAERYDLLHQWTMPTESRRTIRIFSSPVPRSSPPEVFARALRERPREDVFAIARIGSVRGVYCTGWQLVQAAYELGCLSNLMSELESLNSQNIRNADVLLMFAKLADEQGQHQELIQPLQQLVTKLNRRVPKAKSSDSGVHALSIALGAAALNRKDLQTTSSSIFQDLSELAMDSTNYSLRSILRSLHGEAVQQTYAKTVAANLHANHLKYWVPVTEGYYRQNAAGAPEPIWLSHEEHLLHLAGDHNDILFFRYPLAGEFEFSCEAQEGGRVVTDGGLVYGGLQFFANSRNDTLTIWDANFTHRIEKVCPYLYPPGQPEFNTYVIRSENGEVSYQVNRHPMWSDHSDASASPWIGLRAYGNHRPLFRNIRLSGSPVIPRSVNLIGSENIRGWTARLFAERITRFHDSLPEEYAIWKFHNAEIQSSKLESSPDRVVQSLLRYQRPILTNETIQFDFYYQPGEMLVHPAFDRLAFLMEPEGVRIHWITDNEAEWTTLPTDNAIAEPFNRRGPRPLPLNANDWNAVRLIRSETQISLELNGETIYVHPLDKDAIGQFGFYRDRAKSSVRVRNVVLTGDWPETVPQEFLQDPTTTFEDHLANSNVQAKVTLCGEEFLADNVRRIRRHAANLPDNQAYQFLADWVCPSASHTAIRLTGEFTPTDPSPLAFHLEPQRYRSKSGGEFVSPVADLLVLARKLNKLNQLIERVKAVSDKGGENQRRARLALLSMLALESNDSAQAEDYMFRLLALVNEAFETRSKNFTSELQLVDFAVRNGCQSNILGDLISRLYQHRHQAGLSDVWNVHLNSLLHTYLDGKTATENRVATDRLRDWIPVSRTTSARRGQGIPHGQWDIDSNREVSLRQGDANDFLLYRWPLSGQYQVTAEIHRSEANQILAGGRFCGSRLNADEIIVGNFRDGHSIQERPHLWQKNDKWHRFRAVIDGPHRQIYLNGGLVLDDHLAATPSPWAGFHSSDYASARFRNFLISGSPKVPSEVIISESMHWSSWLPYFQWTTRDDSQATSWELNDDPNGSTEIIGRQRTELAGSNCENLLRYQRPLAENETIEYEFYYSPKSHAAHPAFDRMVFLLDPAGVRVHWVTDGRHDRTSVDPANETTELENRRGPKTLPLNFDSWNQMKLSINGNIVSAELNGQLVYERPLETTNRRTFGLFHFADQTGLKVRKVVMRGDWPTVIPPPSQQGLSDPELAALDQSTSNLKAMFSHDFAQDGMPPQYFNYSGRDAEQTLTHDSDGLHSNVIGNRAWVMAGFAPRFSVGGDFDIRVEIAGLQVNDSEQAFAILDLLLADPLAQQIRVMRGETTAEKHALVAQFVTADATGQKRYLGLQSQEGSLNGTLRVVRIDKTIYWLFAEGNSQAFRILRSETVHDADIKMEGVQLKVGVFGGGEAKVVWKNLTMRAESLKYLRPRADEKHQVLAIMKKDGRDVRQIASPKPGYQFVGSPEFSADGKKIVFDTSTGPVSTSRIMIMDSDGKNLKDVGPGCMPSLSPDGKQIVQSESGRGVVLMDVDGQNRRTIDRLGWGAQFSPDGRSIAYGRSGNIFLMDLKTEESQPLLLGKDASRYRSTYWNLGWSHDSRAIAFLGARRDGSGDEVVVIDIEPTPQTQILYTPKLNLYHDFTFSADNQQVLFAMQNPEFGGPQIYSVSRKQPDIATLWEGQPENYHIRNCEFSPTDGKIAFSGTEILQPVEWVNPD